MNENEIARIVHCKIETPIILSSSFPVVMVLENPRELYDMVTELQSQFGGEEGNFILLRGDERLPFEKYGELVTDIYSLEFNGKKILSALEKSLEKISADGTSYELFNKTETLLAEYFAELFSNISLPLTYEHWTFQDVFKASEIRINQSYDNVLEKIACYIDTMVQLKKTAFFVFVHLKSVLTDNELLQLYSHCEKEKVALLLIEDNTSREFLIMEKSIIITDDLCEIVDKSDKI